MGLFPSREQPRAARREYLPPFGTGNIREHLESKTLKRSVYDHIKFDQKAIWARFLNRDFVGESLLPHWDYLAHWAYIAHGTAELETTDKILDRKDYYFIAHWNPGEFVPSDDANVNCRSKLRQWRSFNPFQWFKSKPMIAHIATDKKAAATHIQSGGNHNVWVEKPPNTLTDGKRFVLKDNCLLSPSHPNDWEQMLQLTLTELYEKIKKLECSGKKYDLFRGYHCQTFAEQMYISSDS